MFKKIFGIIIVSLIFFTGCNFNKIDVIQKFKDKVKKLNSYYIEGVLEVTNNESTYKYDITVAYEKDEKYRVSLKNKTNNHEQIILKNSDGVYVLTPALNKSFKFQSEWPYSNSQSYLYQSLINDIENDNNSKIEKTKNGNIIKTKVNYSNSKELLNQKIYLDNNQNIKKVEVLDKAGNVKIKMTYNKTKHNKNYNKDYFKLSKNVETKEVTPDKNVKTTTKIFDISYPLYIPKKTKLLSQDTISDDKNGRTILTFSGDKSFTIIEEAIEKEDVLNTISVSGDLEFVNDVIGNVSDNSVSWISNGVEYYAVSKNMDTSELLEVANSMNTVTVSK